MVQIFDKMQNQLYVEQEKYSAAMRQVRQLEKQVSSIRITWHNLRNEIDLSYW